MHRLKASLMLVILTLRFGQLSVSSHKWLARKSSAVKLIKSKVLKRMSSWHVTSTNKIMQTDMNHAQHSVGGSREAYQQFMLCQQAWS